MIEKASELPLFSPPPNIFGGLLERIVEQTHLPPWVVVAGGILVASAVILGVISLAAMILIYAERKVAGHIQSRLGPMRVGWHGILQSIADGLKLLVKEDVVPANAHRFLFSFAPALVLVGALVPFAALPFADVFVVANMDAALFFVLAFAALEVIGVIMAGWASNSKWSLYGGMRLAAQMMSYEIPMGLSALTVVLLAGTLNFNEIAAQQTALPYIFISPWALVAFVIFYVAGLASAKRAPFDLPEAESELVSGFHTEYSGMRFAFFFLAEYAVMVLVSMVASLLFLGGWNFPYPAAGHPVLGAMQLLMKTSLLLFVMLWLRWTLPRVRIDQVMYMCLKVLLPFSLVCLIGAAFELVMGSHIMMWVLFALLVGLTYSLARSSRSYSAKSV